jgi:hypothetical protein
MRGSRIDNGAYECARDHGAPGDCDGAFGNCVSVSPSITELEPPPTLWPAAVACPLRISSSLSRPRECDAAVIDSSNCASIQATTRGGTSC